MAGQSHLKPGERSTIVVRIDSRNKPGHTTETVEVRTNDPKQPIAVLTLEADIVPNAVVIPPASGSSDSHF